MAAFRQYALQEKDDAITAVRIVDRVTLAVDASDQIDAQDAVAVAFMRQPNTGAEE